MIIKKGAVYLANLVKDAPDSYHIAIGGKLVRVVRDCNQDVDDEDDFASVMVQPLYGRQREDPYELYLRELKPIILEDNV